MARISPSKSVFAMLRSVALPCGILMILLGLAACAVPDVGRSGRPIAFHDTRLQYAVLTDDRVALQRQFQMAPNRLMVERIIAGAQLPFAAAIETVTWPLTYGLSSYLDEPAP
jgi:hypothetical protein